MGSANDCSTCHSRSNEISRPRRRARVCTTSWGSNGPSTARTAAPNQWRFFHGINRFQDEIHVPTENSSDQRFAVLSFADGTGSDGTVNLNVSLPHHRAKMFERSYRARNGAIVQAALGENVVAQPDRPAFRGDFVYFGKGRDLGDSGPNGIGSRIYGDNADGSWQNESSRLRKIRKKITRLRKNTITCFREGEILMKIRDRELPVISADSLFWRFRRCRRYLNAGPERRRRFREGDCNFRALPYFFPDANYAAGSLVTC